MNPCRAQITTILISKVFRFLGFDKAPGNSCRGFFYPRRRRIISGKKKPPGITPRRFKFKYEKK